MIVRPMLPQEMDVTVNLTGYYADEAAQQLPHIGEEYDVNAVIETIKLYSSHHEYFWYNAYEGERPVGFVAGCITKSPWSNTRFNCHIDMIYLLESHRSLAHFRLLLDRVEEFARTIGAKEITAGDLGIDLERTKKVYGHFDFKEGLWMSKEISE